MVSGILVKLVTACMRIHIFLIAWVHYKNWNKALTTIRLLKGQIKKYTGAHAIRKVAHIDNRYYWDMYGEGWPSRAFIRNVQRECNRIHASPDDHVGMRNVLFGITTKCPLKCEHCYEWDNLNLKERLSFSDLQMAFEKLITYGVGQIHLGGGEPMMRYHDIIALLQLYSDRVGIWIVTSGFQLTEERAYELKRAGLTGVCVSLDHHEEAAHNRFRNDDQSYQAAHRAATAARNAGLVTALSLCATKEFTTEENIRAYIAMGRSLGVSFIQFLDPRAVGHYEGKDVKLSADQKRILEEVFLQTNTTPAHQDDPIIIYHEYYKPTLGCRGAGNGAFYIDPLGEVHACPFCRKSAGNLLTNSLEECVHKLRQKACAVPLPSITQTVRELETIEL